MTTLNDIDDEVCEGRVGHPGRTMTEEEFVAWCPEKCRAEWVDGEVVMMAAVSLEHSDLNWWLASLLRHYAEHRDAGVVRGPEVAVRFPAQRRRRLPDILFVAKARSSILRKNHVEGAPDLMAEIVSPDSQSRDWRDKYLEYEAAGVREYWVIDPASQQIEVYGLGQEGRYQKFLESDGKIASAVLPGLYVRPDWLWQHPLPSVLGILAKEFGVSS